MARTLSASLILASILATACRTAPPADLVFRGGAIYTMDSTRPRTTAVAVRDGRIIALDRSDVAALVGPATTLVDLGPRMLLPGFQDAHVHPIAGGRQLGACSLNGLDSPAAVAWAIGECAEDLREGEWLVARGWELPAFPAANPDRRLLDSLVPDRPAYLVAMDGHSAWVNTRALELAGVAGATPDPPEGRIERDPDGRPSGTLRENAMALVGRLVPEESLEDHVAALRRALAEANRFGITALHEARADSLMVQAYATLADSGALTARVVAAVEILPGPHAGWAERIVRWRERTRSDRFEVVGGKIFLDGVIESGTAALLEPYLGTNGDRGTLNVPPDSVVALVRALDSAGLAVHFHTIGDRAVRVALAAIATTPGISATLAHVQLVHPDDIPRLAALGVVAAIQPLWAYRDRYIVELTEPVLGPARSRRIYPFGSLARAGVTVAAGSDWPVTSLDPLRAIEVAVTRRDPDGPEGPPWLPDERLTLWEALRAYTLGAATAMGHQAQTGSITVGKQADLVVLERDLFTVPAESLATMRVSATYLAGRQVYPADP